MNILHDYKKKAENFSIDNYKLEDINKGKGRSFELEVNDAVIKNEREFFLYDQVVFKFKNNVEWSTYIHNPFNNSDEKIINIDFALPNFNQISIDHIIVKPYAVFILEAKNHRKDTVYIPKQLFWQTEFDFIDNPVFQVLKYASIIEQFLKYYNILLPVIPKVIFRQKLNLEYITKKEQGYCCHISELSSILKDAENKYPKKHNDALRFVKAMYYNACHPVAYDDIELWSKNNANE